MTTVHVRGSEGAVARALAARLGADLATSARDATMVVDLAGPSPDRRAVWRGDIEEGRHVLATSLDPEDALWAEDDRRGAPAASGPVLLPNAGAAAVLGDLLASLAADAASDARSVHVSHLVAERGGLRRAASRGLRREVAALGGGASVVVADGTLRREAVAEGRRLAWFARPVGAHHAASVWAPEVVTIARHVPSATTIQGHLAMPTWRAEAAQAFGRFAKAPTGARVWQRWWSADHDGLAGARWATVAEAEGSFGVARAWANGRDLTNVTVGVIEALVEVLRQGPPATGALAPAQLAQPAAVLDALAEAGTLRWSVLRPDR